MDADIIERYRAAGAIGLSSGCLPLMNLRCWKPLKRGAAFID